MDPLVAVGRRIGLDEGVQHHLGDEKTHQRAAREQRGHRRRLAGRQLLAVLAQVADEGTRGHRAAVAAETVGTGIEAPGMMPGIGVPQIAFGAGKPGVAFRTVTEIGQGLGFVADPGGGRPKKGAGAAAAAGEFFIAEAAARELDPAGKRFVVDLFRPRQIAQGQPVAVVHVHRIVAAGFHQDAAGARITDIQYQIDADRLVEPGGRAAVDEGEAQPRRLHLPLQQGQHGQPRGLGVGAGAQFGLVDRARGATAHVERHMTY